MMREWIICVYVWEIGQDKDVLIVSVVSCVIIFLSGSINFDIYYICVWLFIIIEKIMELMKILKLYIENNCGVLNIRMWWGYLIIKVI